MPVLSLRQWKGLKKQAGQVRQRRTLVRQSFDNLALIWFPEAIADWSQTFLGASPKDAVKRQTPAWIIVFDDQLNWSDRLDLGIPIKLQGSILWLIPIWRWDLAAIRGNRRPDRFFARRFADDSH